MGRTVAVTGHRPNKLKGGYTWNTAENKRLITELTKTFKWLIEEHEMTELITGGAIGVDQYAFQAGLNLKELGYNLKLTLAIPYESQPSVWQQEQRKRYEEFKTLADKIVYVDTVEGYRNKNETVGEHSNFKLFRRNEFMVDRADILVGVWDGTKGGTYNCIKYAQKDETKEFVFINPNNLDALNLALISGRGV